MYIETPDNWAVLRIENDDGKFFYKILAGWSGGYLTSDSWKLNSGIIRVEIEENFYKFYGLSGSCYHCGKESYGVKMNTSFVLSKLISMYPDRITLMPENTDWPKIYWNLSEGDLK